MDMYEPRLTGDIQGNAHPNRFLVGILADELGIIWTLIKPFLEQASERNIEWSAQKIRNLIESREAQLWTCIDQGCITAVGVTQIVVRSSDKTSDKVLRVLALAGKDMQSWLPLEKELALYGKAYGCTKMDMEGRLGWKKVLSHWKPLRIVMERDI